jgi:hypothetical protein
MVAAAVAVPADSSTSELGQTLESLLGCVCALGSADFVRLGHLQQVAGELG